MSKDRNLVEPATGILPAEDEVYAQFDKGINITASGTTIKSVTVTSYDAATNIGTGVLVEGAPITYTNGTGLYLVAGDVVAVATDTEGNNVAVAIISRAGAINPGELVPIYPDTNFPIELRTLTNPIYNFSSSSTPIMAYDAVGGLGLGTDLLLGLQQTTTSGYYETYRIVRALNITSHNSSTLGAYGSGSDPIIDRRAEIYVQPNGGIFIVSIITAGGSNTTIYFRNPSTGLYSTINSSVSSYAFDRLTGAMYFRSSTSLYAMYNGDTSASTISTSYNTITLLCADNGYVAGTTGGNLYRKPAVDTTDWTLVYTGATGGNAIGPTGDIVATGTSGGYITFTKYQSTNISTVITTSIASATANVEEILVTSAGVTVFTAYQRADLLVTGQSSSDYGIGLFEVIWNATYPNANTALLVAQTDMMGDRVNADSLQQISQTAFIWGQHARVPRSTGTNYYKVYKYTL